MSENRHLSEREHEILQLVATGVSNKEIAYQLSISTNTTKVHVRNIFTKLGVASRTAATFYAIRKGLVQVDRRVEATPPETLAVIPRAAADLPDNIFRESSPRSDCAPHQERSYYRSRNNRREREHH